MAMCTSCESCESWNPLNDTRGQCRNKTPLATLIPQQGVGGPSLAVVSYWPETNAGDWCGDGVEGVSPVKLTAPPALQSGILKAN